MDEHRSCVMNGKATWGQRDKQRTTGRTRQDKTDQKEKRGRGRRGQARARQGRARQGRRQAGKDRPTGRAKAGNNDCHHTGSHTLFVSLSSLATRAHLLNPVWCPRPARCQAPNVIARWSPSPGGRVPSAVLVTAATPTSPWFVLRAAIQSFIHAVLLGLHGLPRVALALSRRIPHPSLPPQSCLLVSSLLVCHFPTLGGVVSQIQFARHCSRLVHTRTCPTPTPPRLVCYLILILPPSPSLPPPPLPPVCIRGGSGATHTSQSCCCPHANAQHSHAAFVRAAHLQHTYQTYIEFILC